MNKLNVLYIIWSLDQGGAERVVIDLAKNTDKIQFNVTICCLNEKGTYAHEAEKAGIKVIPLHKLPKLDPFIIFKISRLIKKKHIDIVITHLWTSNFWGRIAAFISGVKVIIATEHTTDENRPWYYHLIDQILAKISTKIIAVSTSVKAFHQNRSHIPPCKFEVINNGIDIKKFNVEINKEDKRKEFGFIPTDFVIGLFGRFVPAKAHEVLLQSLQKLITKYPNIKVLFVGSGPTEDQIKEIVREFGLENHVIFAGFRNDIPELYQILDLFILPSEREGFPITLLEAMTSGIPVIATDVGGNSDIIKDGRNGFIIEPNNVEALTQRIEYYIEHPDEADIFANKAQSSVQKHFTSQIMTRNTEQMLIRLYGKQVIKKQKIKLLLVIDHLDPGGAQRQIIELIKRLPRSSFDISLCSLDGARSSLANEIEELGIPLYSINQHGFFDTKALLSLYKIIKGHAFDIVHTYLFTSDVYGRIAAFCAHTPGIICSLRSVDTWKNPFHILVDRILAQITDIIIVNVKSIIPFLADGEHIASQKIHTIYNGIDLEHILSHISDIPVRQMLHLHENERLVGIFARNDPIKDHMTFFRAAKIILSKHKKVKFLAMGDGMSDEAMQSQVDILGIQDKVILLDHSNNYLDNVASVDVSVLTSLIEGCSNVILESMALRKPVVATSVGGNPELVEDGKTGYLVPPKAPEKLAEKIMQLLSNPERCEFFGKNGQQRVKEFFSMDKMVDDTIDVYKNTLKNKKRI
ncbi:MAG: glycosyltransferase [Candidatus Cloacimonetes bacterium]|nr:glycosyltransferase [Candidatus Cloacimonadota bacterium]